MSPLEKINAILIQSIEQDTQSAEAGSHLNL